MKAIIGMSPNPCVWPCKWKGKGKESDPTNASVDTPRTHYQRVGQHTTHQLKNLPFLTVLLLNSIVIVYFIERLSIVMECSTFRYFRKRIQWLDCKCSTILWRHQSNDSLVSWLFPAWWSPPGHSHIIGKRACWRNYSSWRYIYCRLFVKSSFSKSSMILFIIS